MKKRIISLVLAIALMFGTVAVASAQTTTACENGFLSRFLSNCSNSATAASCSELMNRFVGSNGQLCSASDLNDDVSAALVNAAKSSCPSSADKAALAATDDSSSDQSSPSSDESTGTCSNGSSCKDNVCSDGSTCTNGVCSDGSTCTNGVCSDGSTCTNGVCSDGSTCTNGVCSDGSTCTNGVCSDGSTCTNSGSSCPTNVAGSNCNNLYDIVCNMLKGCGLSVFAGSTCTNGGSTNSNSNTNSGTNAGTQTPVATPVPDQDSSTDADNLTYEEQVLVLVNEQRAANGLSALTLSASISNIARAKSQDMHDKNYFSHTSPTYGSAFDMLKAANISYRTAGENIAMGYATPEAVVTAWMNSSGHRANILNSGYTQLGVGYVADGSYWTQIFVG